MATRMTKRKDRLAVGASTDDGEGQRPGAVRVIRGEQRRTEEEELTLDHDPSELNRMLEEQQQRTGACTGGTGSDGNTNTLFATVERASMVPESVLGVNGEEIKRGEYIRKMQCIIAMVVLITVAALVPTFVFGVGMSDVADNLDDTDDHGGCIIPTNYVHACTTSLEAYLPACAERTYFELREGFLPAMYQTDNLNDTIPSIRSCTVPNQALIRLAIAVESGLDETLYESYFVLSVFFFATDGLQWSNRKTQRSWLGNIAMCEREGLTCNDAGLHV